MGEVGMAGGSHGPRTPSLRLSTVLNHSSIALRSYECPSDAITGSAISVPKIGQVSASAFIATKFSASTRPLFFFFFFHVGLPWFPFPTLLASVCSLDVRRLLGAVRQG